MKTKGLNFSKAIIKNDIRSFGIVSIVFTFFILFTQGVGTHNILNGHSKEYFLQSKEYLLFIEFPSIFDMFLLLIVPILFGILFFNYIQKTNHVSMIHSMPYKRVELLNSHIVAANIIYMVPLIINVIIIDVILVAYGLFSVEILIMNGFYLLGHLIIFNVIFLMTVGIGMMVGSLIIQLLLSYIFIALPIILYALSTSIVSKVLYAYPFNAGNESVFYELSPLFLMTKLLNNPGFQQEHMLRYCLAVFYVILAYILARLLYSNRDLERNTDYISYDFVKYIFIYGVTFCGMSLGGVYLNDTTGMGIIGLYIGFFIGGVISYVIAQMIANKTVFIWNKYKGILVYTMIVIVLFITLQNDFFGYSTKTADKTNVNKVVFTIDSYMHNYDYGKETVPVFGYETVNLYSSEEAINHIVNIHEIAVQYYIDHKKEAVDNQHYNYYYYHTDVSKRSYVYFNYSLDGLNMARGLNVPYQLIEKEVVKLMETDEYIYNNNPILWEGLPEYENVYVQSLVTGKRHEFTKAQGSKLVELIRNDIYADDTNNIQKNTSVVLELEYQVDKYTTYTFNVPIDYSYKETYDYMNELGLVKQLYFEADTIDELYVFDTLATKVPDMYPFDGKGLKLVPNPDIVQEVLNHAYDEDYLSRYKIVINVTYDDGITNTYIKSLNDSVLIDKLTEYIN